MSAENKKPVFKDFSNVLENPKYSMDYQPPKKHQLNPNHHVNKATRSKLGRPALTQENYTLIWLPSSFYHQP